MGCVEVDGHPVLVHCTAGKDRTGWAIALLLLALGVDKECIVQDYLLSNALWYRAARKYILLIRIASGFRIRPEACAPLFLVRREYLEVAINAVCMSHGSVDNYLTSSSGLGL